MLQMHAQIYLELKVESDFVFVSLATKLGQKWNSLLRTAYKVHEQNTEYLGFFALRCFCIF